MPTCRDVIKLALTKGRIRARGDEPDAEEARDALATLQSFYDELVATGAFGRMTDVIATANYEAGENERVTPGAYTITRPVTVEDEDSGEDRPPRDKAIIQIVGAETYVYSAPLGAWVQVSNLALGSAAPFAERSFDGLASTLALRLMEDVGQAPTPVLMAAASRFRSILLHNSDSPREVGKADFY